MPLLFGQIYRVRNWDHCFKHTTLKYGLGRERRNRVAIMVCLGEENLDGSNPVDLDTAMLQLGFKRTR